MKYINVIVENKSRYTDNFFTYRTDRDDIFVGAKVIVPFGAKNRPKEGFVFEVTDNPECSEEKLKDILEVRESESLTEEIIKTARWMKQRYAIRYFDGVRCFIPGGKPAGKEPGKKGNPVRDPSRKGGIAQKGRPGREAPPKSGHPTQKGRSTPHRGHTAAADRSHRKNR